MYPTGCADSYGLLVRRLLLAGLLVAAVVLSPPESPSFELRVTPVAGGEPLFAAPLEPGGSFTLHYVHSVDKAPIWERHRVDRHGMVFVEEERFRVLGAGMGQLPGEGRLVSRGPDQVIEGLSRPVGDFVLRVGGPGVRHTIVCGAERINLSLVVPGEAVVVSVGRLRS